MSKKRSRFLKDIERRRRELIENIKEQGLGKKDESILLAVAGSSALLASTLYLTIVPEGEGYDFSEYLKEDIDSKGCFLFAVYMFVSSMTNKFSEDEKFREDVGKGLDWIIENISEALGVDAGAYFYNLLQEETKLVKGGANPLDVWLEADINFYNKLLDRNFGEIAEEEYGSTEGKELAMSMFFSQMSIEARKGLLSSFEQLLKSYRK